MVRRFSAQRALDLLRGLESDQSDDGDSDVEDTVNAASENGISSESSSESETETVGSQAAAHHESAESPIMVSGMPPNYQHQARDGTEWHVASNQRGRLQRQNVFSGRPGPTPFSMRKVHEDIVSSSFSLLFDERILRHILRCTNAEGRCEFR